MRSSHRLVVLVMLLMLVTTNGRSSDSDLRTERLWIKKAAGCSRGLHRQPDGPFAVLLFCEDALGDHLSVVYLEPLGGPAAAPFAGSWAMNDRVWEDALWGSDITSFAWGPDGRRLYVATSEVYGSGGLFELDLVSRKARQIAPVGSSVSESAPGADYTITRIDEKVGVLYYSPDNGKVVLGGE